MERKIGFTTTAGGPLVFGIFVALNEFERELIRERTIARLSSARARGRNGGRPYLMRPAKLRLAQAAMAKRDTKGRRPVQGAGTLYRFVDPKGELRADGTKLLKRKGQSASS
jgi:DNA invertase Pin-like site-specific DNA recombinase